MYTDYKGNEIKEGMTICAIKTKNTFSELYCIKNGVEVDRVQIPPDCWKIVFEGLVISGEKVLMNDIRRKNCVEMGMFDENLLTSEDYEFMINLLHAGKVTFIGEVLVEYRQHTDSLSNEEYIRKEVTHRSIHYYHKKWGKSYYCNRCNKLIEP